MCVCVCMCAQMTLRSHPREATHHPLHWWSQKDTADGGHQCAAMLGHLHHWEPLNSEVAPAGKSNSEGTHSDSENEQLCDMKSVVHHCFLSALKGAICNFQVIRIFFF